MVEVDLDALFCLDGKKYRIHKLLLKAIGIQESSLKTRAYRFEPAYFEWLKKKQPGRWDARDPRIVSASYGIMQVMYTTAVGLGFDEDFDPEDLYNPVLNIEAGARVFRANLDGIEKEGVHVKYGIWPYRIALARYNGGPWKNPDEQGVLRNIEYVNKVFGHWRRLRQTEEDICYA
jgi:soluble lytic murein transglycosylase-like protein